MKFTLSKQKAALAFVGLIFASPSFGVELVTNGTFSGNASGWTTNYNAVWSDHAYWDIATPPRNGALLVSNFCSVCSGTIVGGYGTFSQTVNTPITGTYGLTFDYGIRYYTSASTWPSNTNTLTVSYDGSPVGTMQFTPNLGTSSISINRSGTISTGSFAADTSYPFSASYSISSSSGSKVLEFSYSNKDIFFFIDNISFSLLPSSGPSALDTQSSIQRLASGLRGSYNSASLISNFPNSNTYDCNLFDVKGMCISAGGRYSTVDNPSSNSTAAVVTLGYKVNSNIRIGGFLDQSVNNNNPTGINLSNKNPMMGAFLYWNQNADGLGYQVKVANAFQDKDLSTTRDVIGTSEAGTGKTSLNSTSYLSELSYAFMYKENTLVRPYFALRYTTIEQDAYTETGVTTPLTYSALNDRTTSALMGVKFKHALTPKANLIGSLGVEQDLHHKTGQLTASGVSGLTSENFSGNLHRTRPVASIGATYDIAKTQRLSGEVLVQQLPFQSTAGATAYFNYMIGF
jgi:hypothetical protein